MLLSEQIVTSLGKTAVADTTAETLSAVEDMEGFDGIRFIIHLGDVDAAAVLTLQPKENSANSTSSPTPTAISLAAANLAGAVTPVITSGAAVYTESSGNLDNKTLIIDIQKSMISKRYVFLSITVATESYEIVAITTEKYKARTLPVSQNSGVVSLVKAAA
jgi:hypothetical protein